MTAPLVAWRRWRVRRTVAAGRRLERQVCAAYDKLVDAERSIS